MPIVVPDKKALMLNLRDPAVLDGVLPRFQKLTDHVVAVPHRTKEFMVLKNMGVKIDGFEPIGTHYDWPEIYGRLTPMPHQKVTASFITSNPRGYILNQQRTGKTASAVWAVDFLKRDKAVKAVLIITTLSTMKSVWVKEFFSIAPHLRVGILHGSKADRIKTLGQRLDVYIINHDGLKVLSDELVAAVKSRANAVLIDEVTNLSNHTTDIYAAAKPVCDAAEFCWAMTGSPLARGAERVYGITKLVTPDSMPYLPSVWRSMVTSAFTFQVENPRTGRPVNVTKYKARSDAASQAYAVMQPMIRFAKADVLKDLPPITRQELLLKPTAAQARAINEMRRLKGTTNDSGEVLTAANAGVLSNKLMQICGGAAKTSDGEVMTFDVSNKTQELLDLIDATDNKVLVFSNYHAVTDLIVSILKKKDIKSVVVDGRVTGRKRDRAIESFQNDAVVKVLVAHPETTAHGLEFSVADTTVWWTLTTDPELFLQAEERMASAAQKNPMGIYYLFAHPIEQAAYRAMVAGVSVQDALFAIIKRMQGADDSSQFAD